MHAVLKSCLLSQSLSIRLLPNIFQQQSKLITMTSGPTYSAQYLTDKLKKSLEADHVDIEDLSNCGCGMKFDAILVSSKFEGQPILKRQRLVNEILSDEMKHIHAFTMQTWTPNQWKEKQSKTNQQIH